MQERAVYVLPMRVLLETMRELSASVTVQAQLAALPEGWNEPCVAELVMVEGLLHACTIRTVNGLRILQQEAAFQMVERLGTLQWSVQLAHEQAAAWKVACSISSEDLASLSRRHKQVFLLSESHKSPAEIARLLRLSVQQVEQILHALHHHDFLSR